MASRMEQIIEDIEEYIDGCKYAPMSHEKIVVNKVELEELLSDLKMKTPEEIKRYQKIINNKEAILADAQAKADQIIAQAQIQTSELVSEHQIMQQAYAQANEVVMLATKQAQDIWNCKEIPLPVFDKHGFILRLCPSYHGTFLPIIDRRLQIIKDYQSYCGNHFS